MLSKLLERDCDGGSDGSSVGAVGDDSRRDDGDDGRGCGDDGDDGSGDGSDNDNVSAGCAEDGDAAAGDNIVIVLTWVIVMVMRIW